MTHYEERLSEDLQQISRDVREISEEVCFALENAVEAAITFDKAKLHDVAINDFAVNRRIRKLDKRCHQFVAVHLPAAKHLRFVSSVLRMTIALERADDYAVTAARVSLQMGVPLPAELVPELEKMTELSIRMMSEATRAFLKEDGELAKATKILDYTVDKAHDAVFEELAAKDASMKASQIISLLKLFGRVERFGDQAKNICEEALFVVTGKMKEPKIFKVLFVDETNEFCSQLACALAEKTLPEKGIFSSAGWNPGKSLSPQLAEAAEALRLDISSARPTRIDRLDGFPVLYHVVVGLNLPDDSVLPHIPYHTIFVNWTVDCENEDYMSMGKDLSNRIAGLLRRLRGKNEQ